MTSNYENRVNNGAKTKGSIRQGNWRKKVNDVVGLLIMTNPSFLYKPDLQILL